MTVPAARRVVTCLVHGRYVGLDVSHVREVVRYAGTTRVPRAQPSVAGLVNLRGRAVTAIDLRLRMGLPPRPDGVPAMNVVVRLADTVVSIVVDTVGDVVDLPQEVDPAPDTLPAAERHVIAGTWQVGGRVVQLLDPRAVADLGDID